MGLPRPCAVPPRVQNLRGGFLPALHEVLPQGRVRQGGGTTNGLAQAAASQARAAESRRYEQEAVLAMERLRIQKEAAANLRSRLLEATRRREQEATSKRREEEARTVARTKVTNSYG
ncbi:hypothetical protein TSOC_014090 [Tetrabaena socialis]|uniref:Uncharacterized protein n=1 Tax=Tetrabaena socialis TaxID=47790 RepID=A0A2J7ZIL3_9CHLO|nr:hypothetical protein TSOC_014090 [Tetrabaena socialis]|eukprot:PNH00104.1 hypothetical protein TSOC_014090 [Tetrabaena socialis]